MLEAKIWKTEDGSTDELVKRVCTDADALGELYEKYYEPIYKFCCHRIFCAEAAKDVCSEVFLSAVRSIGTFKGNSEKEFASWLWGIAINEVNASLRKAITRRRLLAKAVEEMEKKVLGNEAQRDWSEVYQAIAKLKPKYQTIITLRYFEGMSFEEIGRITGIDNGAARGQMHRAMTKLRKYYKALTGGEIDDV